MGVVTPCGIGVEKFWDSMLNGKSGVSLIESIDTEKHTVKIAGEIKDKDFNPEDYMSSKDANRMDRFTQFAMVASDEAIADAGLDEAGIDPYRIGVMVSSAAGGFKTFEKNHMAMIQKGPTKGSPFTVPMLIVDMASGRVSMKHGYKGVNKAVVSACATGSHSIGDAFRTIQYGDADVMVAGGCEATITTLGIGAFTAARTLSKRNDEPEKASRPYDKDRDGFVMGEGAGVLVLEEYELAKKRGAHIYAEIVGYGQSADAYDMVVNGVEVGGGSIRIHDAQLQAKMFEILGFTPEKAQAQFGFLMNAFKYGAPPHGGLAYGLDRWVSLFAGLDSIRDCIAFPKNNSGRDVMLDAPSEIDQTQLDELNLIVDIKENK